jgi:prepilin-type N-terminal cleavage/methylation domain-containing protein
MNRRTAPARRAFTAIELAVVISIIGIVALMIAPKLLDGLRRSAVRSAANAIVAAWREARTQAMSTAVTLPTTGASAADLAKAYGVAIVQAGGGKASVKTVFDDATTNPDALDPSRPLGLALDGKVVVSTRDGTAGAAPTPIDGDLVWYAQKGTGVPIRAADLALGGNAPPCGVGVRLPSGTPSVARELIVHTLDFDPAAKRGFAVAVMIYPVGVAVTQELVR